MSDWIDEVEHTLKAHPLYQKIRGDFVGSPQSHNNIAPGRSGFVLFGVPHTFRKLFVQIFETDIQRSFLYWDDSNALIESAEYITTWMVGDSSKFLEIKPHSKAITKSSQISYSQTLDLLENNSKYFVRVQNVGAPGQYSVRGDVVEIWAYGRSTLVRLEYFDQILESISELDLLTRTTTKKLDKYYLVFPDNAPDLGGVLLNGKTDNQFESREHLKSVVLSSSKHEYIKDKVLIFADDGFDIDVLTEVDVQEYDFALKEVDLPIEKGLEEAISAKTKAFEEVIIVSTEIASLKETLSPELLDQVTLLYGNLEKGIEFVGQGECFLTDHEIFGVLHARQDDSQNTDTFETFVSDIRVGDFVVHEDHGIGRFMDLVTKEVTNEHGVQETREFILLAYGADDTLYIPVSQRGRIIKYVGADSRPPKLTRLDGKTWQRTKKRIQKKVDEIARELLELYAEREVAIGYEYRPDSPAQKEMEADFAFTLTRDQKQAISEIKADMESPKLMDRLLVGDVGYGKTELAMRAAFKAVESGRQVALLTPTTLLADQHARVFEARLKRFGVNVISLSRLNSAKENTAAVKGLSQGKVDIVIGTHRLLSKDIEFADLGLLIVDEEQRFGVKQKEKIKAFRGDIDVLTMSATPIPRTLHMGLSGLRDISVISTPPPGRLPVETSLNKFSWEPILEAVQREIERGGQVYLVHNTVSTIYSVAEELHKRMPKVRVGVGHGQMTAQELSGVMRRFESGETDVLVSTTIIENGIDLPNVNTIIIDEAEMFGLSDLYQLRGRVGRSDRQAYCLLLYRGKGDEYSGIVQGTRTSYERELDRNVVNIELAEEMKEASVSGGKSGRFGKSFSARLLKAREELDKNKARKRLRAIMEAKELGSGFDLSAKDLEIRGAGNLLGKKQHGFVSSVGLGLYLRMLGQTVGVLNGAKK